MTEPTNRVRRRRRRVAVLLLLFTAWPLVHYQWTQHYRTSPWKLFGWAMYTKPRYVPTVEVYRYDPELGRRRLALAGPEFARAEAEWRRFVEWSEVLGTLVVPDALAQEVRSALPRRSRRDPLEVVVLRFRVDRTTAKVAVDRETYFYEAKPRARRGVEEEQAGAG